MSTRTAIIFLLALVVLTAILLVRRRDPAISARFAIGDRVQVAKAGLWADRATGTVAPPSPSVTALADGWSGHVRTVHTTSGPKPYYWVILDEPRRDADGDGPYQEAELAENWLQPFE